MKILTALQIREADQRTIAEENIPSAALMERAANAFTEWFTRKFPDTGKNILICCGPGNNGGDGLAIARMLHALDYAATVWIVAPENKFSPDFLTNQERLPAAIPVTNIKQTSDFPEASEFNLVLDGLFGTGLSRSVTGIYAEIIQHINHLPAQVIAIDVPSGLYTEAPNQLGDAIVQADYTLSFEVPKLAFLLAQNEKYVGEWYLVAINLSPAFLADVTTDKFIFTREQVTQIIQPRRKFSHKGTYGHALLLAGSYGKMGAAALAARACLRSGVGLLSVHCPKVGYTILQTAVPEAMTLPDTEATHLTQLPDLNTYQAIGIGPGLGKEPATRHLVRQLLQTTPAPLVIDADALNIIAEENLQPALPPNTILTPHPKEFERLAGPASDDYNRLKLLQNFCRQYGCFVVLKGGHTCIGTPAGDLYFNITGNPGMATGGTGDVLTGIITALVAQKYSPLDACRLGVYLHGLAGDLARDQVGETALIASDLIENLGAAFRQFGS
ncbi:bifunctional NAD(P)H-hydrate repair enzyme [Adhaeribacter aerolatus]|uniref:Bifunctional NAD(P)H-hydrate repair enzyme n=1 Tax=Adhaeribacter aerolatus TaxID=670289 RepID=A0A512B2M6_9BACT|nr:NAD(P)H-hydrate dehydratase [Adhaeribacter aerolatus]GEO06223.1 bifunctional NAD(P)H-hydrate repair enzyme [Adhaeribacter aerolatus]